MHTRMGNQPEVDTYDCPSGDSEEGTKKGVFSTDGLEEVSALRFPPPSLGFRVL